MRKNAVLAVLATGLAAGLAADPAAAQLGPLPIDPEALTPNFDDFLNRHDRLRPRPEAPDTGPRWDRDAAEADAAAARLAHAESLAEAALAAAADADIAPAHSKKALARARAAYDGVLARFPDSAAAARIRAADRLGAVAETAGLVLPRLNAALGLGNPLAVPDPACAAAPEPGCVRARAAALLAEMGPGPARLEAARLLTRGDLARGRPLPAPAPLDALIAESEANFSHAAFAAGARAWRGWQALETGRLAVARDHFDAARQTAARATSAAARARAHLAIAEAAAAALLPPAADLATDPLAVDLVPPGWPAAVTPPRAAVALEIAETALAEARSALARQRTRQPPFGPARLAAIELRLARGLLARGDADGARRRAEAAGARIDEAAAPSASRAAATLQTDFDPADTRLRAWLDLARLRHEAGYEAEARDHRDRARALYRDRAGKSADLLLALADTQRALGDVESALETISGRVGPGRQALFEAEAIATLVARGDRRRAGILWREARRRAERRRAPPGLRVAALARLARLGAALDEPGEPEAGFAAARALLATELTPERHPPGADPRRAAFDLARALAESGRAEAALKLAEARLPAGYGPEGAGRVRLAALAAALAAGNHKAARALLPDGDAAENAPGARLLALPPAALPMAIEPALVFAETAADRAALARRLATRLATESRRAARDPAAHLEALGALARASGTLAAALPPGAARRELIAARRRLVTRVMPGRIRALGTPEIQARALQSLAELSGPGAPEPARAQYWLEAAATRAALIADPAARADRLRRLAAARARRGEMAAARALIARLASADATWWRAPGEDPAALAARRRRLLDAALQAKLAESSPRIALGWLRARPEGAGRWAGGVRAAAQALAGGDAARARNFLGLARAGPPDPLAGAWTGPDLAERLMLVRLERHLAARLGEMAPLSSDPGRDPGRDPDPEPSPDRALPALMAGLAPPALRARTALARARLDVGESDSDARRAARQAVGWALAATPPRRRRGDAQGRLLADLIRHGAALGVAPARRAELIARGYRLAQPATPSPVDADRLAAIRQLVPLALALTPAGDSEAAGGPTR